MSIGVEYQSISLHQSCIIQRTFTAIFSWKINYFTYFTRGISYLEQKEYKKNRLHAWKINANFIDFWKDSFRLKWNLWRSLFCRFFKNTGESINVILWTMKRNGSCIFRHGKFRGTRVNGPKEYLCFFLCSGKCDKRVSWNKMSVMLKIFS